MSKTKKLKTLPKFNGVNDEIQIAMYEKVQNFKTVLGKFVKNEGLNFYYDVDDELLEIVAKTELLDYDIEDNLLTDLEERTKYSTNTRIALFFGYLEDKVGFFGEYNQKGYLFSAEDWEDIVRGILFEEDFFETLINIDVLNQMLEKEN